MIDRPWIIRHDVGMYELGEAGVSPDRECPIVGVGPAVLVAAAAAVRSGQSMCFVRRKPKLYGTRRQVEGAHPNGQRVRAYVTDLADVDLLASLDFDIADVHLVETRHGEQPVEAARHEQRFHRVDDLEEAAETLTDGPYTRSSGEVASYYIETLRAACTYDIAATFADRLPDPEHDIVAGVAWGGVFLAAAVASQRGSRLALIDPLVTEAAEPCTLRAAGVLLVDDLLNRGGAIERCRARLARHDVGTVDAAVLYAFAHSQDSLSKRVFVGATIDANPPDARRTVVPRREAQQS